MEPATGQGISRALRLARRTPLRQERTARALGPGQPDPKRKVNGDADVRERANPKRVVRVQSTGLQTGESVLWGGPACGNVPLKQRGHALERGNGRTAPQISGEHCLVGAPAGAVLGIRGRNGLGCPWGTTGTPCRLTQLNVAQTLLGARAGGASRPGTAGVGSDAGVAKPCVSFLPRGRCMPGVVSVCSLLQWALGIALIPLRDPCFLLALGT